METKWQSVLGHNLNLLQGLRFNQLANPEISWLRELKRIRIKNWWQDVAGINTQAIFRMSTELIFVSHVNAYQKAPTMDIVLASQMNKMTHSVGACCFPQPLPWHLSKAVIVEMEPVYELKKRDLPLPRMT